MASQPIHIFYLADAFFILDSARLRSLTLRDYSKVVSGYKLSLSAIHSAEKRG